MWLHFKDDPYDAQLLRAVGHPTYQGSELGECLATVAAVRERDADDWYEASMKTARRVQALADESLAVGQTVSRRAAYLRASNYYRTAYVFIFQKPIGERLKAAYDGQSEAFRKAAVVRPVVDYATAGTI